MPDSAQRAWLSSDAATQLLGTAIANAILVVRSQTLNTAICIHLIGELGAGKSTLARALLRGFGVTGAIKSPTYALIEPYESTYGPLLHLDLYRLSAAADLEYLGVDTLFADATVVLIEWPEKAAAMLIKPDLEIRLSHAQEDAADGRMVAIAPFSANGIRLMFGLASWFDEQSRQTGETANK
jgi:tRNA threonylcarbamoyladenosine biosynthesis protein TsaE